MSEERFAPYYGKMARVLGEMIPVKWTEIYMVYYDYEGVSSIGMYFRIKNGTLHWCNEIPSEFHVDKEIYRNIRTELSDICEEYKKVFHEETGDDWPYMSFCLTEKMEFKAKYYYDVDLTVDIPDMMDRIFYDSYQIRPSEEYDQKELQEYIDSKKANEK